MRKRGREGRTVCKEVVKWCDLKLKIEKCKNTRS